MIQQGARSRVNSGLFRRAGDGAPPADRARDPAAADAPDALGSYLREIGLLPLLSPSRERELAERVERGDPLALEALVQVNLRLVVSVARRYANHGVDLLDLIQEGNLGLLRAAARFDRRRGARFPTYASWWVRQAITQALTRQRRAIRLPGRMSETVRRLERLRRELMQPLGREPTLAELAAAAGMSAARAAFALRVARPIASLDAPAGGADADDLWARLPDAAADPAAQVARRLLDEGLAEGLLVLPARERQVLALHFGLAGERPHSLAEIGARLGVSREQARQLERRALGALRRRLDGEEASAGPRPVAAAAAGG